MDPAQSTREYITHKGVAALNHRLSADTEADLADFGVGVEYQPVDQSDWVLMHLYFLKHGRGILHPVRHTPIPLPVEKRRGEYDSACAHSRLAV